jgi:ankyrin repeat protein
VHGANVNITGKDSLTPLHVCCTRGDYKALNVLLQSRPSLTQRTKDGKTALEIAETKGFEDICSRLTTLLVSSGNDSTLWHQHTHGDRSTVSSRSGGRDRDKDKDKDRRKKKQEHASSSEGREGGFTLAGTGCEGN